MNSYEDFSDQRIKHMDMIQAVVARLSTDSFLMKGWAITLAAALLGFAVNFSRWELGALAIWTTGIFWSLDMYFLRAERLFRALFARVRQGDPAVAPFFMAATGDQFKQLIRDDDRASERAAASWWKAFFSLTLGLFYGLILSLAVASVLIIAITNGASTGPGVLPSPGG
jgi:hypothetical protein